MPSDERPPPIPERFRTPARIVALVVAYLIYRGIEDDRFAAGVFLGLGAWALSWTAIDSLTLRASRRLRLLQAGTTILGLGLVGLGLLRL